jgi:hypothetical protein
MLCAAGPELAEVLPKVRQGRGGPNEVFRMRWLLTGALLSVAVLPRAEAADLPEVLKRGTLRALVVVSEEEAYFVSSRPDAPPGFDAEVLEGFARLHKLKLAIVPVGGWDALIPSLLKGKGDLIAGGFTDTASRRRQIDFTAEVFPTRSVAMTRKPRAVLSRVEELRAEKVGTVNSSACSWASPARSPTACARRTLPCSRPSTSTSATCAGPPPGAGSSSSTSARPPPRS